MAIKDFLLAGLILSAQLSEAAVIGSNKHWLHQRSLNATASEEKDKSSITASATSPASSSSSAGETKETDAATYPESAASSLEADSPTSADHATSALPTDSHCHDESNCEDGEENGNPVPEDGEEGGDEETPADDETPVESTTDKSQGEEKPSRSLSDEPGHEDGQSENPTSTSVITNEDGEVCTPLSDGEVVTVFSVIYTETVTWTDDPDDYTAPFPTMPLPTYCEPTTTSTSTKVPTTEKPKLTTVSGPDDGWNTYCGTMSNGTQSCLSEPIFNPSFIFTSRPIEKTSPLIGPPEDRVTSTFFITSKNPTVVFPPEKTPDYGQETQDPPGNPGNGHHPVDNGNLPAQTRPPSNPPQSAVQPSTKVTITAEPTRVIIGDRTLSNLKPGATTKVTVGGVEYEINPSQIVQAGGHTVNRPGAGQALVVGSPITSVVDGIAVTVSGSRAIIGGYTYSIGSTPSTEVVQGHTVVISPTGISFEGSNKGVSYQASPPEQTGIIVAGGEMMTAIGASVIVIHETTITYGPGIPPQTETVDDDTIVIGEGGVTYRGLTISDLGKGETRYDVVGGATLTRVGPSKIVIGDVTYTVGPGTGTTTTFVGGEDITIAPDGVTVATLTIPYPFGATVVTAIPAPKTTEPSPQQTEDEEEEDGAGIPRPGWVAICIAIGAWLLL